MWQTGWWLSPFQLIAGVRPPIADIYWVARYDMDDGPHIFLRPDPDPLSDAWIDEGPTLGLVHFPYGWDVFPD